MRRREHNKIVKIYVRSFIIGGHCDAVRWAACAFTKSMNMRVNEELS